MRYFRELISVIVPVYNIAQYIEKCVRSICDQTYKELEILLVDDGSNDSSGLICDSLAEEDKRIAVIHKKNEGVSSARNLGLKLAQGQYVIFIDGDDWCQPQMLELLYAAIVGVRADIAICGGCVESGIGFIEKWIIDALSPKEALLTDFKKKEFDSNLLQPFIWNKLFSKELLDEAKVSFPMDLKTSEDTVFLKSLFPYLKKAVVINDKLYNYRVARTDSLSYQICSKIAKGYNHIRAVELVCEKWKECGYLPKKNTYIMEWAINFIFWQIEETEDQKLSTRFIEVWNEYEFDKDLKKISKLCRNKFLKIKKYADTNKKRRKRFLLNKKIRNKIKRIILKHEIFDIIFNIYWNLRYKNKKALKAYLKWKKNDLKRRLYRDGIKFHVLAVMRILHVPFEYDKYKRISALKSRHDGKRCFIVAPGPSLDILDVEKLENEYCFAVNGTMQLKNLTTWRPTYYVLFDGRSYDRLAKEMGQVDIDGFAQEEAFLNYLLEPKISNNSKTKKVTLIPYCNGNNSDITFQNDFRYTKNLLWGYYDLATVTNAAICIAQYMGFKEIYLLGVDCDYLGGKHYFIGEQNKNIPNLDKAQKTQERQFAAYQYIKEKLEKQNIKIYNATRGGALEVFERVDFDSLFR